MRKFLSLLLLTGVVAATPGVAAPLPATDSVQVQTVQFFDGGRHEAWRRHEARERWRRHAELRREREWRHEREWRRRQAWRYENHYNRW